MQLTFRGKEKVKTGVGACLTITFLAVLGVFGLSQSIKLNTLQPPVQVEVFEDGFYELNKDLDPNELVQPELVFAFGLGNKPVDPLVGRFVVR